MTGEAARHVPTQSGPARPVDGGTAAASSGDVTLAGWTWKNAGSDGAGGMGGSGGLRDALDKAFDFRGDVTLTLDDGARIAGYVFDRRGGSNPCVRLLCAGSDEKIEVAYAKIRGVDFSDKDPAAGKSFETWVKKYVEKKRAGLAANIESESLE